jgi:DNA-binding PadR family transcriptional regulator
MAGSGRTRHRDRDPGRRYAEDAVSSSGDRLFRITEAQRQEVARALRFIDEARRALEAQQNRENREIVRELKASADRIFDLLNDLEEITGGAR